MELKQITPYCFEIPQSGAMNVPGRVYISGPMAERLTPPM